VGLPPPMVVGGDRKWGGISLLGCFFSSSPPPPPSSSSSSFFFRLFSASSFCFSDSPVMARGREALEEERVEVDAKNGDPDKDK